MDDKKLEERRAKERARWHRRYADPEFRKKELERNKTRVEEWRKNNRERYLAIKRKYNKKYYAEKREEILAKKRAEYKLRKEKEGE